MKTHLSLIYTTAILCAGSFWMGSLWSSRDITTYRVDQIRVSFHGDWPVYGLPIMEYQTILADLRRGATNNAIHKAECYLDNSIYDAKQRRPLLSGWRLSALDKSIRLAAQYRVQHPREKLARPESDRMPGSAEWLASNEIVAARRHREIDSFLQEFR